MEQSELEEIMRLVDLSVIVCVRLSVCVLKLAEMCTLTRAFYLYCCFQMGKTETSDETENCSVHGTLIKCSFCHILL